MRSTAELFKECYGKNPEAVSRAPGRLEILGNHTDYNEGFVLSAATGQATEFAVSRASGRRCRVIDAALGKEAVIDLDRLEKNTNGDWTDYLKGVLVELERRGVKPGAFDALLQSSVPLSAGMSSSAALEISFCFALRELFGIEFSKPDWARIGQAVENKYMGLKSGLLDQFSSIFGAADSLILCDFRSVEVLRHVPMNPDVRIVVANTLVKHNLVESDYNRRRESCERVRSAIGAEFPAVKALRDADMKLLESFKGKLDAVDYRRALHIVGENERVMRGVSLLEAGDVAAFGKLLFESHASSRYNFENSCAELDALVEIAKSLPDCFGARLSGGGFGGITIHLIRSGGAETYCGRLRTAYKTMTGKECSTVVCPIGNGASASAFSA